MTTNYTFLISLTAMCGAALASDPMNIGDRRELFLDNVMVDRLEGGAQRVFHKPVPRQVVMKFGQALGGRVLVAGTNFHAEAEAKVGHEASSLTALRIPNNPGLMPSPRTPLMWA